MELLFLYFVLISFAACFFGGLIGLGGGIISVPLFMLLNNNDIELARTLSFFCILILGIVGVIKYSLQKTKPDWMLVLWGFIGVIPGVLLGLFFIEPYVQSSVIIFNTLFIIIDIFALILIFVQSKFNQINLSKYWIIPMNFGVGIISSVLGIGGGILFVPILYLFFSKNMNNIAPNNLMWKISIAGISFFTSIFYFNADTFSNIDISNLWLLLALLIGSVAGGILGPLVNKRLKSDYILWIYVAILGLLIIKEIVSIILNII